MPSATAEEYLELFYELYEKGEPIKTRNIATQMNVAPATVTEMLQKFQKYRYITYKKYYGAEFTDTGYRIGRRIKRRHRLLEYFLYQSLGIVQENIHRLACELEHAMSKELEDAICKTMNVPKYCPDDNKPIPPCNKAITSCTLCLPLSHFDSSRIAETQVNLYSLVELEVNNRMKVEFIHGYQEQFDYLHAKGISPGIILERINTPDDNEIRIRMKQQDITLTLDDAYRIFGAHENSPFP